MTLGLAELARASYQPTERNNTMTRLETVLGLLKSEGWQVTDDGSHWTYVWGVAMFEITMSTGKAQVRHAALWEIDGGERTLLDTAYAATSASERHDQIERWIKDPAAVVLGQ